MLLFPENSLSVSTVAFDFPGIEIFEIFISIEKHYKSNLKTMTVSHKDWELSYSRIWLAEADIEWLGLNFPIVTGYILRWKMCILKYKNIAGLFSSNNIHKNGKEDEPTLTGFSSAHRRSQAKCQLVQTSYITN